MALATASIGKGKDSADFIKKYISLSWGHDIQAETSDRYKEMQDYYMNHVRNLSPTLEKKLNNYGEYELTVSGLEGLTQ